MAAMQLDLIVGHLVALWIGRLDLGGPRFCYYPRQRVSGGEEARISGASSFWRG
jgi:hypothetical protein